VLYVLVLIDETGLTGGD